MWLVDSEESTGCGLIITLLPSVKSESNILSVIETVFDKYSYHPTTTNGYS